MSKIRVGIVGAAGYAGGELIRLLVSHPECEITALTRVRAEEESNLTEVHPQFRKSGDQSLPRLSAFHAPLLCQKCDVVFIAAPHGQAIEMAPPLLEKYVKVIDLGADFRLKNPVAYEKWYNVKHTQTDLLATAVYGLPEVNREALRSASLVANPGCYPTSASLPLVPLVKGKLIDASSIVIDSKSGVSGAGRSKMTLDYFFTEVVNDFKAYNVGKHRHMPEIEQTLSDAAGEKITVTFVPHLLPISRGILTTVYASLAPGVSETRLNQAYEEAYGKEPFVRLYPGNTLPQIKYVVGSNYCDIGFVVDARANRVIVISAIDNLVKGAAGQAIQNMNLMFGVPETTGLMQPPFFP